tara:strand:+ start:11064 stop:11609 length:546 start_codon:yes stop_codon:yes gene_type:complete
MSAFAMLAILMASSMGCIGLVPAREFMEDLRDPPELIEEIERINVDHVFVTDITDLTGSTNYTQSFDFIVDSDVSEISAYITAAMALDLIIPVPTEVRYVKAILTDADGNQIWYEELTETKRPAVATFQQPLAEGTWTLYVDARGYGEEFGNLYKDSFQVLIKVDRECLEFHGEDGCTYDN